MIWPQKLLTKTLMPYTFLIDFSIFEDNTPSGVGEDDETWPSRGV